MLHYCIKFQKGGANEDKRILDMEMEWNQCRLDSGSQAGGPLLSP